MTAAVAEIGHNQPPEPTPYEAVKVHLEDLLTEARNWADGAAVETQAQADEISRLMGDLNDGLDAADAARVEEKQPWDEKANEVQERYNAYIAPLKNKKPGKVPLAIAALKASLAPFLKKLDDEKRAIADAARKAADDAAAAAAEAMRAAQPADLESREAAEALVETARIAAKDASRAEKDKAHARGGSRAIGLRTNYVPVLTSATEALKHYVSTNPDAIRACLLRLAEQDVAGGKRTIPGFVVNEERVL